MNRTDPETITRYTAAIREHAGDLTATIYRYIDDDHGAPYATVVVKDVPLERVPERLAECGWRVTSPWLDSRTGQGMARVADVTPVAVQPGSE